LHTEVRHVSKNGHSLSYRIVFGKNQKTAGKRRKYHDNQERTRTPREGKGKSITNARGEKENTPSEMQGWGKKAASGYDAL